MIIKLDNFGGIVPRLDAKDLPVINAQEAMNCRMLDGKLSSWRQRLDICAPEKPGTIRTIYLFGREHWFHWTEDVQVARGAIGGDTTERTYFVGGPEGQPQVTDNTLAVSGNEESWEASKYYSAGDYVVPTVANGYRYKALGVGTSGATEPTWLTPPSPVIDGGIVWASEDFPDHTPPGEQSAPAICWALPERSYHLGVPAPTTSPTVGRDAPSGTVQDVRDFSTVSTDAELTNVIHDGQTEITIRCTILSFIQVTTDHTSGNHTVTYKLFREDELGFVTEVDSEVINVEADTAFAEPMPLYVEGQPEVLPKSTLEVAETNAAGTYRYYVTVTLANIDADFVSHQYGWGSSAGLLDGLEIVVGAEHPFEKDDRIVITGVVGIPELNATHTVYEIGPDSVFILFESGVEVSAADYVSGGTWIQEPSVANSYDRIYVYTFLAIMGGKEQEGPPSPPSTIVALQRGDNVNISDLEAPPAGYNISRIRIYRTVEGEASTNLKFVKEIGVATSTVDDVDEDSFGEDLPSVGWSPPPTDLANIVEMPGGILAGTANNELCFCEPYQPHAWPLDYRKAFTGAPVALGAFGNSVVVLTDSFPWLATGTHPDSMTIDKLEIAWSCVSRRSVVDMGYSVVYASPDGLVAVGPGQLELVTRKLFTEREWSALNPSSILAARHDSAYVFFYDTGSKKGGMMFDPREPVATLTELNFHATAMFTDNADGSLYMVVDGELFKFNADLNGELQYLWRSKRFTLPKTVCFSAGQVHASAYPVQFNLYTHDDDGVKRRHSRLVESSRPFRMPGGYRATDWEIELGGFNAVTAVFVAESVEELKRA